MKDIDWKCVVENLIIGYFFKNVVADNLAVQTSPILLNCSYFSGQDSLAALFGYSTQIFADFAGYSLIAIGLAAALGYRLPTNFNFPFRSQSLSEFWTRWHITLSTWIRDYLYFPLGGNKKGQIRTYLNILIVMFLGGLWHGGKVGFAVWGLYHGVGLCVERVLGLSHKSSKFKLLIGLRITLVFIFITAGSLLYAVPLHSVPDFWTTTISNWSFAPSRSTYSLSSYLLCRCLSGILWICLVRMTLQGPCCRIEREILFWLSWRFWSLLIQAFLKILCTSNSDETSCFLSSSFCCLSRDALV